MQLDFQLDPKAITTKCFQLECELIIRTDCFEGRIIFNVDGQEFGIELEPLLDFALALGYVIREVDLQGFSELEYSGGGPCVTLRKEGENLSVELDSSFATVSFSSFIEQHRIFCERLYDVLTRTQQETSFSPAALNLLRELEKLGRGPAAAADAIEWDV